MSLQGRGVKRKGSWKLGLEARVQGGSKERAKKEHLLFILPLSSRCLVAHCPLTTDFSTGPSVSPVETARPQK